MIPIPNKFTYRYEPNTGRTLPQSEWKIVTLPDGSDKETEYWFDHLRINQLNWSSHDRTMHGMNAPRPPEWMKRAIVN